MDEFLKMDIFFFVTTLAVIALAFFTAFVLWRLERVLKNVEYISKQVAEESDDVRHDIDDMRRDIQQGSGRLKSLFSFLQKFTNRQTRKTKKS